MFDHHQQQQNYHHPFFDPNNPNNNNTNNTNTTTTNNFYNIPSIITYLQKEFRTFENDKELWELERSELLTTISNLNNFRKTNEKIQFDLLRRIKMLEFTLRMEREKNELILNFLKNKEDLNNLNEMINEMMNKYIGVSVSTSTLLSINSNTNNSNNGNTNNGNKNSLEEKKEDQLVKSVSLLKSYLKEIDSSDLFTLLSDIPNQQVNQMMNTSLLLSSTIPSSFSNNNNNNNTTLYLPNHKESNSDDNNSSSSDKNKLLKKEEVNDENDINAASTISVTSSASSVLTKLSNKFIESNHDLSSSPSITTNTNSSLNSSKKEKKKEKKKDKKKKDNISMMDENEQLEMRKLIIQLRQRGYSDKTIEKKIGATIPNDMKEELEGWKDDEDVDNKSNNNSSSTFLNSTDNSSLLLSNNNSNNNNTSGSNSISWNMDVKMNQSSFTNNSNNNSTTNSLLNNNNNTLNNNKIYKPKYNIKSHLDSIKCLELFDDYLISGSDDCTIKIFNLNKLSSNKSNEPIQTLRGHLGSIYSLKVLNNNLNNKYIISGGQDEYLYLWNLPNIDNDPYTNYGYATPFLINKLKGHSDSIWSIDINEKLNTCLSASSDDCVILWNLDNYLNNDNSNDNNILKIYNLKKIGTPTCVNYLPNDKSKFMVSFTNGKIGLFDIETGKSIYINENANTSGNNTTINGNLIYQFKIHNYLPFMISGCEDKKIKYFDINNGKLIHEMIAHKDAVTSISIDYSNGGGNGLYFASCGHDASLRIWDISTKHCVQELPAHMEKKYDEAIHYVTYHNSKSLLATAGADSIVKVFTC